MLKINGFFLIASGEKEFVILLENGQNINALFEGILSKYIGINLGILASFCFWQINNNFIYKIGAIDGLRILVFC